MHRRETLILTVLLVTAWTFLAVAETVAETSVSDRPAKLRVYLPRETAIDEQTVKLSGVSVIRGDESLATQAKGLVLGQFSEPAQQLVFSRAMILARVACSGIKAEDVEITGAEKVVVTQRHRRIPSASFVQVAHGFFAKNLPAKSICQFKPAAVPKDLVLPAGANDVTLQARRVAYNSPDKARVLVDVIEDGRRIETRNVDFNLKHLCREFVATKDIASGERITQDNAKEQQTVASRPDSGDSDPPFGLVARRKIPAGTTITAAMTGQARRVPVVKRNRNVVIVFEKPGLSLTAVGKALQDGCPGDCIKVQMRITSSPRTIFAKVNDNGTAEPVF